MNEKKTSRDTLFAGDLICYQHKQGYRFSIDAVLLAHFSALKPGERILDLCAGSGVVGLIAAYRNPQISLLALELQEGLAHLLQKNIAVNGYEERFLAIQGDLCTVQKFLAAESVDVVLCNPPYGKVHSGRINKDGEASIARHELRATLGDIVSATAFAVRNKGRAAFVYPASRSASLISMLERHRLTPKRLQAIYSYPEAEEAQLVLVETIKNGGEGCCIHAPLSLYTHQGGAYTDQVASLYAKSQVI